MKKITFFTVLFTLVFTAICLAITGWPFSMHDHSTASDGWKRPREVILWLRALGYKGAIFTDHNDLLIEQGSFSAYQKMIESFGDDSFIVIGGMEISVAKWNPKTKKPLTTLCHIGDIGITIPDPYTYDPGLDWDRLPDVLNILGEQGSICILNHVKDCKVWAQWADKFDGFELFNDFSTTAQFHKNYVYQRDVYLNTFKSGGRLFVVAGIDLHLVQQSLIGQITTFVFTQSFTKEGILDAIRHGHTVAASNIREIEINIAPSIDTYDLSEDKFKIEGAIKTVQGHVPPKKVIIYKDGFPFKTTTLKSKGPVHALSDVFFFSFEGTADDSESCYTLEIEEFMVTSPFCFRKKMSRPSPLPGKAFRITNVKTEQMFYITEKEGLAHPYVLGSAFEYCYEDFALTPDGFVFGCKNPLMIKGVSDAEDGAVLYYAPEIYKAKTNEENIKKVERSFAITLGKNEYKCVANDHFYCIIIADSKKVKLGDKFYVCDPDGPVSYDKENSSVSCNKTCYGEASSPGINASWTLQNRSGDCPVITSGSVWLVPKDN